MQPSIPNTSISFGLIVKASSFIETLVGAISHMWVNGMTTRFFLIEVMPLEMLIQVVLRHNPPLPGVPDHALPVLNHDQTDHNTKTNGAMMHSNSSVIQLLLYDVITSLANYCAFPFASEIRQIQCKRAEILMYLMDKVCMAEFTEHQNSASGSVLICHISQVKNK